eukprot:3043614-Amphidinium_carterae.1
MAALFACAMCQPGMNLGCGAREGLVIHHQCHGRGITSEFRDCVSGFWHVYNEESCEKAGLDSGAEALSDEMGLHWDESSSQMLVSSEYLAQPDSIEQLTACLVELWHFPAFTTSRWATVGVSCRKLARKGGFLSDYISSGLDKCDAGILRFAAVA